MIDELRTKKILYGVRGQKPVNFRFLKNILVKISKIPMINDNLTEMDINPIIINDISGKVVDARIVFEE